jgi:hypothetical protein
MAPTNVLSQIHLIKQVTIDTSLFDSASEGWFVHSRTATSNNNSIQGELLDFIFDQLLPGIRTHEHLIDTEYNIR